MVADPAIRRSIPTISVFPDIAEKAECLRSGEIQAPYR
jgi:hypothetical protein